MEYDVLTADTLDGIVQQTKQKLTEGWQCMSPIQYVDKTYIHEMIRVPQPPVLQPENLSLEAQAEDEKFMARYMKLDEHTRDLLSVNNIQLVCNQGRYATVVGDKTMEGISPTQVLTILRSSKHCPADLDEAEFLKEIGSLV